MDELRRAKALVRAPEVLWRRSARACVLLAPHDHQPMVLHGSGAVLWELLGEQMSMDDLFRTLAELYGAEIDALTADVQPVIEELVRVGAVVVAS